MSDPVDKYSTPREENFLFHFTPFPIFHIAVGFQFSNKTFNHLSMTV